MINEKVRLKDVANEVGVSIGAVGYVLNGTGVGSISVGAETEKRIREAADRLGYRVNYAARQLRGGKSGIIGLITHKGASAEGLRRIVDLELAASAAGLDVMVAILEADRVESATEKEQAARVFERFALRGVDGVISMSWSLRKVSEFLEDSLPIAHIGPAELLGDLPGVRMDAVAGGRIAAQHLVAKGKQKIGMVLSRHAYSESRVRGASEALQEAGLELDPRAVITESAGAYGDHKQAERCVPRLVEDLGVDGIIMENDHWAMRILNELQRRNISVPGQVSVIGYNNLPFCEYVNPALTSMDEREEDIASAAVAVISGLIDGRDDAVSPQLIRPLLVERAST